MKRMASLVAFGLLSLLFLVVAASVALTIVGPSSPRIRRLTEFRSSPDTSIAIQPKPPSDGMYDVAVIGCGPAGLTAALFAARAGLSVIVLGSEAGSLSEATSLDNFPSWDASANAAAAGGGTASGNSGGTRGGGSLSTTATSMTSDEYLGGPGWLVTTRHQAAALGATFAPPGLLATGLEVKVHDTADGASAAGIATNEQQQQQQRIQFSIKVPPSSSHYHSSSSSSSPILSRSVIVATGSTSRRLNLPNESILWGRSLHSCAICDGSNYADRRVLVVGGGDAAVDAALLLSRHAESVLVVHRRTEFRASSAANLQALHQTDNIEVLTPYTVVEWQLTDPEVEPTAGRRLKGAVLAKANYDNDNQDGDKRMVAIDGAFIMIGASANTDWLRNTPSVRLTNDGLIKTDSDNEGDGGAQTSQPGLYAAGEVRDGQYRQAITAAAEGAKAAIDAERWLRQTWGGAATTSISRSTGTGTGIDAAREEKSRRAQTMIVEAKRKGTPSSTTETESKQGVESSARNGAHDDDANEDLKLNGSADPDKCNLTSPSCIRRLTSRHAVVVFSKTWCPYCRKALEVLALEQAKPYVINLTAMGGREAQQIQATLESMTGRRTVPNVFVGGKSIGGGDETTALHGKGELRGLLRAAGAVS